MESNAPDNASVVMEIESRIAHPSPAASCRSVFSASTPSNISSSSHTSPTMPPLFQRWPRAAPHSDASVEDMTKRDSTLSRYQDASEDSLKAVEEGTSTDALLSKESLPLRPSGVYRQPETTDPGVDQLMVATSDGIETTEDRLECGSEQFAGNVTDVTEIFGRPSNVEKPQNGGMVYDISQRWREIEKILKVELSDEERKNGYRVMDKVDPLFLGFFPGKRDRRRFLKAIPLVGPPPPGRVFVGIVLPDSAGQRWFIVITVLCILGVSAAGIYHLAKAPGI